MTDQKDRRSWATVVSLFYFVFWAVMRGSNFARPSALHRGYVNIWLFIIGWAILVAVTAVEDRKRIGGGYIFVFFQTAVFFSTFLSLCELFSLPKKTAWGQKVREDHEARDRQAGPRRDSMNAHLQGAPYADNSSSSLPAIPHHASLSVPSGEGGASSKPAGSRPADNGAADTMPPSNEDGPAPDAEESDERTPLLCGDASSDVRTTFATTYRRSITAIVQGAKRASEDGDGPYEHEQSSWAPSSSFSWRRRDSFWWTRCIKREATAARS